MKWSQQPRSYVLLLHMLWESRNIFFTEVLARVLWEPTGSHAHPSVNYGDPGGMQHADWVRLVSLELAPPKPSVQKWKERCISKWLPSGKGRIDAQDRKAINIHSSFLTSCKHVDELSDMF